MFSLFSWFLTAVHRKPIFYHNPNWFLKSIWGVLGNIFEQKFTKNAHFKWIASSTFIPKDRPVSVLLISRPSTFVDCSLEVFQASHFNRYRVLLVVQFLLLDRPIWPNTFHFKLDQYLQIDFWSPRTLAQKSEREIVAWLLKYMKIHVIEWFLIK